MIGFRYASPDAALLQKLHALLLRSPGSGRIMLRLEEPGTFQADDFAVVAIYPDGTWEEVRYHVPRR